ncbi:MAG TPA: hypothetical protein VGA61_20845, partial [Anaerolineae bacterium]
VQTGRLDDLLTTGTEVDLRLGAIGPDLTAGIEQFGTCSQPEAGRLIVRLASEDRIPALVAWLAGQDVPIYGVIPRRLSLEEVFMRVMEGEEAG